MLFTQEATENGNLNENTWGGKDVKWIIKPSDILIDKDLDVKIKIEITQLPYPPIFKLENIGEGKDIEIRNKY